jgi:hypothetical protein
MNLVMLVGVSLWLGGAGAGDPGDWVDLTNGWRFRPDPARQGRNEGWQTPPFNDNAWTEIDAGKRWEDQGFPDVDGYAWYRRHVDAPVAWQGKPVWLVLGGVNDACEVFCNGERVNTYGDERTHSVAATPLIIELSKFLRFDAVNLIAIACYDWGASGGLWCAPCAITTDQGRLPLDSLMACSAEYENRRISVDTDLAGLGNERAEAVLSVEIVPAAGSSAVSESPSSRSVPLSPGAGTASVSFDLPQARAGDVYRVRAALRDSSGAPIAGVVASTEVTWPSPPAWPAPYQHLKVLNNFVTELLSVSTESEAQAAFTFPNPRNGWVFFSITGAETPRAILDAEPDALVLRWNPDTGAHEAMRFIEEGEHRLRVADVSGGRLDIRTMPEIAYCYYPASPHIAPFGPYDWDYVARYVLPHVNTLITSGPPESEFAQWRREGRQWLANASLPGLSAEHAPTADEVYAVWAANPGVTTPGYGGVMVDEFLWAGVDYYHAWSEGVRRLHKTPSFAGKTFYAWCGDLFAQPVSLEFSRLLMDLGDRFSWEKYLREEPTAEKAQRAMYRDLVHPLVQWRKAVPGVERRVVMCLGYLCAPPESLNLNPTVDYHVFLDMQFHLMATDPTFANLYGIMEYSASYADEESLRWAHRMFRHYCIEGSRSRLINDPYLLPHVANPDFAEGLIDWRVEPAEEGSIAARAMDRFSWLQGRYPETTDGDRFCWVKRSAKGPNRVSQTIKSLEPGRLYSLKLISADVGRLDEKQTLALSVEIRGAEPLDVYSFQFPYPSCYSHEAGPYTREHPAYFNFHRVVFRPETTTAELTISDWLAAEEPGGPIGQEIGFNFVEVQPFLEP